MQTEIYEVANDPTHSRLLVQYGNSKVMGNGETFLLGSYMWKVIDVLIVNQVQVVNVQRVPGATDASTAVMNDLWRRLGVKF
jgi:hypothetical protein